MGNLLNCVHNWQPYIPLHWPGQPAGTYYMCIWCPSYSFLPSYSFTAGPVYTGKLESNERYGKQVSYPANQERLRGKGINGDYIWEARYFYGKWFATDIHSPYFLEYRNTEELISAMLRTHAVTDTIERTEVNGQYTLTAMDALVSRTKAQMVIRELYR